MAIKYHCPRCGKRYVDWGAEKLGFKCPDCEDEELVRIGPATAKPAKKKPSLSRRKKKAKAKAKPKAKVKAKVKAKAKAKKSNDIEALTPDELDGPAELGDDMLPDVEEGAEADIPKEIKMEVNGDDSDDQASDD